MQLDKSQQLLWAKTKADIDGEHHEVEVKKEGEKLVIQHNGEAREVDVAEVISTTLHPTFSQPKGGKWLDLTNAKLVPYEAKESGNTLELKRPDGHDTLRYDANGHLEFIESSISKGALHMARQEIGKQAVEALELEDLVSLPQEASTQPKNSTD